MNAEIIDLNKHRTQKNSHKCLCGKENQGIVKECYRCRSKKLRIIHCDPIEFYTRTP